MTDTLTIGSERLARSFVSPPDGKNCISVKDWVIDLVKADPGIVAMVDLPTHRKFILHADGTRTEYVPIEAVHRAIKKWETGK